MSISPYAWLYGDCIHGDVKNWRFPRVVIVTMPPASLREDRCAVAMGTLKAISASRGRGAPVAAGRSVHRRRCRFGDVLGDQGEGVRQRRPAPFRISAR